MARLTRVKTADLNEVLRYVSSVSLNHRIAQPVFGGPIEHAKGECEKCRLEAAVNRLQMAVNEASSEEKP